MFKAKDGKMFGNNQVGNRYNERFSKDSAKGSPREGKASEDKASGDDVSHQDIHEVVAEHGPAHTINIKHDHEAGTHHVESQHGEGHSVVHHSDHSSVDEAHDQAHTAATPTDNMHEEAPAQSSQEQEPIIPGM